MRRLALLAALTAVLPWMPAHAGAGAPPDYSNTADLSQPVHEIVRERARIPMRDGTRLYAEIWRPAAAGRFGAILEWSPYNSGVDTRVGSLPNPGGLAAYFAPRGYAVVLADLRGTGNSEGCIEYMSAVDVTDGYDLVEWIASRPWSNQRVGMTGVSYVGSTPILTAAAQPPHLATVVPVAGLAQFYDHGFQAGVPYWLQWVGHDGSYEPFDATPPADQDDPGWALNVASGGCGARNTAPVGTGHDVVTGRYTTWHAARDHRDAAAAADIPIFLVQGFTDHAVRPISIEWFMRRHRADDKLWLGQWPHTYSDRQAQWVGVLHRWFDRHLLERAVDTGPAVEVFLNGAVEVQGDLNDPRFAKHRGPVRTGTTWPGATTTMSLYPHPDRTLADVPPPAESAIAFDARATEDGLAFETAPFDRDVEITGFPDVVLEAAIDRERIDVFMVLSDVGPYGVRYLTQATMNPQLRNGLGTLTPVIPGEMMHLLPPAQPIDFLVRKGHTLRLSITSHDGDKVPLFAGPGTVRVRLGGADPTRFTVGAVEAPVLYADPRPAV